MNDRRGFVRDPDGTITEFDAVVGFSTLPLGINETGVITGYYAPGPFSAGGGPGHGFVREVDGTITTFDPPGSIATYAHSINAAGAVTGAYLLVPSVGIPHGFVRAPDGTITTFDPPGAVATSGSDLNGFHSSINAAGAITGAYQTADFLLHGFLRAPDGTFTTFDPPGSQRTNPVSINTLGTIAGYYVANNIYHGFLRAPDGTFTTFDAGPPGGTFVASINDAGVITGNYNNSPCSDRTNHGFVRMDDDTIITFDPPGSNYTGANSINSIGAIAGSFAINGDFHGYLRLAPIAGLKVNVRFHYAANGSAGGWSATKAVSQTGAVSIGPQAMEGNLRVNPGDTLETGYDFTIPGQHPAAALVFTEAGVTFQALCASGSGGGTIVVGIADANYTDLENSPDWYPSGDQQDASVYQGVTTVPDMCGGGVISLRQGATFNATLGSE